MNEFSLNAANGETGDWKCPICKRNFLCESVCSVCGKKMCGWCDVWSYDLKCSKCGDAVSKIVNGRPSWHDLHGMIASLHATYSRPGIDFRVFIFEEGRELEGCIDKEAVYSFLKERGVREIRCYQPANPDGSFCRVLFMNKNGKKMMFEGSIFYPFCWSPLIDWAAGITRKHSHEFDDSGKAEF